MGSFTETPTELERSGHALRVEGVTVFVADGLDHQGIGERVAHILAGTSSRLAAPSRQVLVLDEPGSNGNVGEADRRSEIRINDGRRFGEVAYDDAAYLVEHELAHNAGGSDGGPPDDWREPWREAMRADQAAGRCLLAHPTFGADGTPGVHEGIPMRIGRFGVTAYAEQVGITEDWADAVALYRADQRLGRLVGAEAAMLLTGDPRPLRFTDCYRRRAEILDHLL